jgi:hypothetical protein
MTGSGVVLAVSDLGWLFVGLAATVTAVVYVLGTTPFAPWLLARLERPYCDSARNVPPVGAVVMLAGERTTTPPAISYGSTSVARRTAS